MKYVVLKVWNGEEWVKRTLAIFSVEPMTEPTDAEREREAALRRVDELEGVTARRRRRYPGEPSIEAWDAGCRTVIRGFSPEDNSMTNTSAETINNYLDAINLVDA